MENCMLYRMLNTFDISSVAETAKRIFTELFTLGSDCLHTASRTVDLFKHSGRDVVGLVHVKNLVCMCICAFCVVVLVNKPGRAKYRNHASVCTGPRSRIAFAFGCTHTHTQVRSAERCVCTYPSFAHLHIENKQSFAPSSRRRTFCRR